MPDHQLPDAISARLDGPTNGEAGMAEKIWEISGEYMESCNCDYLCPCIFTNPQAAATHDHCVALMVYRIDRGRHGDVVLDGLKFALVIRSGRVMSDGAGIDDAAEHPAAVRHDAPGADDQGELQAVEDDVAVPAAVDTVDLSLIHI